MGETFSPQERIRKKNEFLILYKKGRRYKGKYFSLIKIRMKISAFAMRDQQQP
jgi:ribonuclease P protein component